MPALELVLTEMPFKPFNKVPKDPERDLYLPAFAAAISVGFLVMQTLYKLTYPSNQRTKNTTQQSGNVSLVKRFQNHVSIIGGWTLFSFRLVRFAACVALAILSWLSVNTVSSQIDVSAYILTSTYVYTSFLAFISVVGTPEWGTIATGHLVPVLLVPWGVFVYRDVWPLATYTLIPADGDEGWFIWAKVFLLTLAAAIVPMTSPRRYIPVDPTDPMPKPNDEQTASWLSRSLFSYCDRTILKAYRQPRLTIDDLPVLADSEYTKNLVRRAYPHIDPLQKKNGHLFYGLVFQVFRREQIITLLTVIIRVCGSLVAPLGINRLLNFMETGGKNATVRPWFWIIWILVGPMMSTLAYCTFFYCLLVIKIEGRSILTQMMFDHALRIRMKADVSNSSNSSDPTVVGEEHTRDDSIVEGDREPTTDPSPSTANTIAKNKDKKAEKAKDALKEKGNLAGKINNLVTADFVNIENGLFWQMLVFGVPLQLILSIFMLYKLLGWSVFPGIAVMVFAAPLPGYLTKLMHGIQTEKMKRSDARIQSVTETINVIRMIKLFGWENKMRGILGQKRNEELKTVRKMKMMRLSNTTINYLIPVLTTITTFTTYTLVMKKELTASLVFPALTIFSLIEEHFSGIFSMLPNIIQAKVSLDRINDFLHNTELLDKFVDDSSNVPTSPIAPNRGFESVQSISEEAPIGIRNSSFTWTADEETGGSMTPGGSHRRNFKLKIEDEVFFKKGRINLIIGPTGSGKTSLLMALLGEMHHIPLGQDALVSLPRNGGVAYHAQESWVLNETIKENILFGSPYDEARYETVIEQCALKHDLGLFEAGDLTEVGEKGITLSGGQKARVTLARAVYSHADTLLLDDVLAALDVHTAKWIVERCLQGSLVQGRTVILVTHNIALASPIAEYVVSLGSDGRISSQGSLSNILAKDKKLSVEVAKKSKEIAEANMHENEEKPDESAKKAIGKLIVEEEVELGHVGWNALKLLFSNMGGRGGLFLFWSSFVITATFFRMSTVYQMFIVTMWSDEYSHHPASEVSVPYYMTLYAACVLVTAISLFISYSIYVFGSIRATQTIHDLFMEKIFGTTLRWLDRTPASRIITRCTADIQSIDGSVTENFYIVVDLTLNMGLKFAAVVAVSPLFGGLGVLLAIIGGTLGNVFIKAQLPIKRQSSNTNAPVMGHFSAAMTGLVSIRAYGAEEKFRLESFKRIDRMSRAARIFFDLNRWISVRTDALAWGFSAALAAYLTYGKSDIGSANTGFSLTMATGFSSLLLIWIRTFNLFETNGNSLERINQYLTIEQEPKPTSSGVPPAYWPASGDLRVENLSARYSADGPKVLRDISFHVKSGERIGIIGRTGSGKSSLTLALLRCILTEGHVYYDNILTNDINLDILRSNITIIPQVPELLSGTLRENLDPFSQYDDATLNDSLRAAGLFSLQNDTLEGKITLDTQIAAGGNNLSVGQRQILALARAIIRQSKLLILDEATSAIDYETDTIIQNSLRKELNKDVTLLTVAHRLQTIMDADKIMVLDSGRIVEFDKPSVLLQNEKGMLRALVDESEDKDKLYTMAAFQGTL